MHRTSIAALIPVVIATAFGSCARAPAGSPTTSAGTVAGTDAGWAAAAVQVILPLPLPRASHGAARDDGESGLRFRVAPDSIRDAPMLHPPPSSEPLPAAAAEALLSRLPSLPAADEQPFRFPAGSPPPPRAGAVIVAGLAPDTMPGASGRPALPAAEPLRVLRIVPEGRTAVVPHVTVTFSRPMVPLTDIGTLDAAPPPVLLNPSVPGRWTWIDPRTVRFVAEPRLPMATRYEIEVPAGTRAADGTVLDAAARVVVETPGPAALGGYPARHPDAARPGEAVRRLHPGGTTHEAAHWARPDQVMLVVFDQQVDGAAVLRTTRLSAGGRPHPVRLATRADLEADTIARLLADSARAGRWVAFAPATPLPLDAEVRLGLEAGTTSTEGPLGSAAAQEMRFRTYGPLRVDGYDCWGHQECRPGQPWRIRFSNPLDTTAWSPGLIRVEPALEGMTAVVTGAEVIIEGNARRSTRYTVRIDEQVRDVFGQRLGRNEGLRVEVGAEEPMVTLAGAPMIVLDPAGPASVTARSLGATSLRVRVHRVAPEDFPAFRTAVEEWQRDLTPLPALPGRTVVDRVVPVPGGEGYAETRIDLSPAFTDGLGHAVVLVAPGTRRETSEGARSHLVHESYAWVQATRIGLSAAVDREEILAWATSLESGRALPGVTVRLLPSGSRGTTGADGLAAVPLRREADHLLIATRNGDTAILPEQPRWRTSGWSRGDGEGQYRWYVFSDRGLYKPGETARLKGWVRLQTDERSPQLIVPPRLEGVTFNVRGPRGEEAGRARAAATRLGGFDTAIELPQELNLGHATVELLAEGPGPVEGRSAWHSLQVQEFRRPEYEVAVEAEARPYVVGDVVHATLRAEYYGGGGLGGAATRWHVTSRAGSFTPPSWQGWHFGRSAWRMGQASGSRQHELEGVTDASGEHRIRVELLDADPPFTSLLSINGEVQDVSRQVGSGSVQVMVHPAAVHVGLRLARAWARPGDSVPLEVVVTDADGNTVAGRSVDVAMERLEWRWLRGRIVADTTARTHVCTVTSGAEARTCGIGAAEPGYYQLRAEVRDGAGRRSLTEHSLWVAGGSGLWRPGEDRSQVRLVGDRDEYQPDDTARILVQPPFHPAEGLLTVRSLGLVRTERFQVDSAVHSLRVPLQEAHVPGVTLRVELVDSTGLRHAAGELRLNVPPHRRRLDVRLTPAAALVRPGGETWVDVEVRDAGGRPAAGAEVAVWMVDEAILGLGGYSIADPLEAFYGGRWPQVRDHASRPWVIPWPRSAGPGTLSGTLLSGAGEGQGISDAHVTVEGVDASTTTAYDGSFTLRGVAAGRYTLVVRLPDGLLLRRVVEVPPEGAHLGNVIASADGALQIAAADLVVTGQAAAKMREAAGPVAVAPLPPPPPPPPGAIDVRADFGPLALFEPAVMTDAQGRARVRVRLPGTLTRYRVMAVAAAGPDRFGTAEASLTARRDLMVRIVSPRFLNHGDRFELPVLVQNMSDAPLEVSSAIRASGIDMADPTGRRISIPAGGRAEVRFGGTASRVGSAEVQVAVSARSVSGEMTDAAAVSIPVYSPGTIEAFALHGDVDDGTAVVLPVRMPANALPQFGGLDVSVTSTALHALADAVLYLKEYPFEGSEQVASRLLAVVALREVLPAFGAPGLDSHAAAVAAAQRDVARLAALQGGDGGWGFWAAGEPSHPFVSVHVAHALERASRAGLGVPQPTRQRALWYLQGTEARLAEWPERPRQSLQAYSTWVRHRLGDPAAAAEARRLAEGPVERVGGELSVEAMAWLLQVLAADPASRDVAAELVRRIGNRADQTAGTATFAETYTDGEHLLLHSSRRTDAIVLETLIHAQPSHELIPRLARSLLAHRTAGRWRSTQENAWVLLALERYFTTFEAATPDFRADVWLGDRYAGGHRFAGRSTDRARIEIPMTEVGRTPATELTLSKDGPGRLYYRAALQYAPSDPRTAARERGFAVGRTYEAVDDPADVRRDEDGTWRIRAGARVRVRLNMVAPSTRYHVALVDPLPAGLEPLNPELRGTGMGAPDIVAGRSLPWSPRWFSHQNLRDERAEAFAPFLQAGSYEYSYVARATTPGTFMVGPPRAEMMYEPETFGRGEGALVVVE
jgi:alpha-2-macroglobulin